VQPAAHARRADSERADRDHRRHGASARKALGTTAELWLNPQNDHDIQIAKRDLGKALDRIETVNKPDAA